VITPLDVDRQIGPFDDASSPIFLLFLSRRNASFSVLLFVTDRAIAEIHTQTFELEKPVPCSKLAHYGGIAPPRLQPSGTIIAPKLISAIYYPQANSDFVMTVYYSQDLRMRFR
jgi:hypothetical protein